MGAYYWQVLGQAKRPAITKHLSNIYRSGELDEDSTCSILEYMGNDGKQKYKTKYYNLDAILSVGYRVNSINATAVDAFTSCVQKIAKSVNRQDKFEQIYKDFTRYEDNYEAPSLEEYLGLESLRGHKTHR